MGVLLRLVTRTSWRGWAVVMGVAMCAAYLTGTLALLEGLREGTEEAASRLPAPPELAYRGVDLTNSTVTPADLEDLAGPVARFWIQPVALGFGSPKTWPAYALAVEDPGNLAGLQQWAPHADFQAALGGDLWAEVLGAGLDPRAASIEGINVSAAPYPDQTIIPNSWAIVRPDLFARLPGAHPQPYFVLLGNSEDGQRLMELGYTVVPAANAVTFLRGGVEGAASDLTGLIAITVAVTLVLVSTLLGLEVRYRARDLALIRALGGSPRLTAALAVAQGLFLTTLGGLLGTALGIMAAHGLVSVAPLLGLVNVMVPRVTPEALALGLGAVPACGFLGVSLSLVRHRGTVQGRWP